jgi:hypothetical protein
MTAAQLFRISGCALLVGSVTFIAHVVLRSVVTAGASPITFYQESSWIPINLLGALGAALVLLGLPRMYARMAGPAGVAGLVGAVLIALAWMFFGVFLSLFGVLVAPWLADQAPALVAATAPTPTGIVVAFIAALVAWFVGTVLLAIPFLRGRVQPRWVGYLLLAAALLQVGGDLIAPNGPATNIVLNLISNLGPVLLLVALGYLGARMWLGESNQSQ